MKHLALLMASSAIGYASDAPAKSTGKPKTDTTPVDPTKTAAATVTGVATLSLTAPTRGGGKPSIYPFATLEVGQVFGIVGKKKADISSAVSAANRKGKSEVKDSEGNVINTVVSRHFFALDVTPEIAEQIKDKPELAGATVLVQRDK